MPRPFCTLISGKLSPGSLHSHAHVAHSAHAVVAALVVKGISDHGFGGEPRTRQWQIGSIF